MSMIGEDTRRAYTARRERAAMNAAFVLSVLPPAVAVALLLPSVLLPVVPAVTVALICLAVVAVSARRSLSNMLAALTLFVAQPYSAGERVRLYAGAERGVIEAEILHIGLLRTTLCSDSGVVAVPNIRMLRAAPEQTTTG